LLGGGRGIGKDTLLEPVKQAIGPWNFQEVGPMAIMGRFNSFAKSVILRISEIRDQGNELDRYAFYDHMKALMVTPPDVLRVDEKHVKEYYAELAAGAGGEPVAGKAGGIERTKQHERHHIRAQNNRG
jgi:Family of unknown function (DUF5906)